MFSRKFLRDAGERSLATFAQVVLALLITAGPVGVEAINWLQIASIGLTAAVISVLKSIAATQVGAPDSASLVDLNDKK